MPLYEATRFGGLRHPCPTPGDSLKAPLVFRKVFRVMSALTGISVFSFHPTANVHPTASNFKVQSGFQWVRGKVTEG